MKPVDVVLIVALDEEYQAIRRSLGISPVRSVERMHEFHLDDGSAGPQKKKIIVHVTGEMGLVPTASATDLVLDQYEPAWLVSTGISGQLGGDCALGDVVVSTSCDMAYSEARLSVDRTEFAGSTFEVPGLKNFLKAVDLSKYLQGRELFLSSQGKRELEERRLWRKFPLVHSGITCSTDFLVDDPKAKAELLVRNRRFLCTDMESAAMVAAARKRDFKGHLAIIRGISDPADGTKRTIDKLAGGGTFRRYAMANVATVLDHAILRPLLNNESKHIDRPLIVEYLKRFREVGLLLADPSTHVEAVARIDSDGEWNARDAEIAKYVYRARISRAPSDVSKPLIREINSPTAGPEVNYYLALHVMRSLAADFETHSEHLVPLTHVHTYEVNQFCKALLESAKRQGLLQKLLGRIAGAYDASSKAELESAAKSNLQAHLCYLLGRVSDEQSRSKAIETLERWRERLVAATTDKRKSSAGKRQYGISINALERLAIEQLLQYRTIQISLVQLGGIGESDRYILSCIASPRLDAQNRGFHLEYYGDIPYDPTRPLSNEDLLGKIPRTLATLGDKLIGAFAGARYPLRDIELYTVIALLRSRLQKGVLQERDRARGLEILSSATWMSSNEKLKMLSARISSDLSNPSFHPKGMVDELFKLKKLRRAGWTARGRKVTDPETVASHTFGGLALIELFLPETNDSHSLGTHYSKEKVLRLFLKHDWAEATIGDLLPDQKTEVTGATEEAAFRTLGLSFMYSPYVNRTIYEDWLMFERGTSINAQLARDVDQLDNLQQLLVESNADKHAIPDRGSWIEYIEGKVKTEWGRQMMRFLLKNDR